MPTRAEEAQKVLGAEVGGYRLVEYLDSGWTADVYRGEKDGRSVAVKVYLSPDVLEGNDWARVQREQNALRAVDHPNICKYIAAGNGDVGGEARPYVMMELIAGESLFAYIRRTGPLDWAAFRAFARPLLDALNALHGVGLRHRDIKPANVRIEAGTNRIVIVDLGLSINVEAAEAEPLTQPHEFLGPVRYAPPEYTFRKPTEAMNSPSVDVYGLGCTLLFMLTGEEPFPELDNKFEIARAHADRVLMFPEDKLPGSVRATMRSMVSKKPELRPTAEQAIRALDAADIPEALGGKAADRLRETLMASDRVRDATERAQFLRETEHAFSAATELIKREARRALLLSPLGEIPGWRDLTDAGMNLGHYRNASELRRAFPDTPWEKVYSGTAGGFGHIFEPEYGSGAIGVSLTYFLTGSNEIAQGVRVVATEAAGENYADIARCRWFAGTLAAVKADILADTPAAVEQAMELAADANERGHPGV